MYYYSRHTYLPRPLTYPDTRVPGCRHFPTTTMLFLSRGPGPPDKDSRDFYGRYNARSARRRYYCDLVVFSGFLDVSHFGLGTFFSCGTRSIFFFLYVDGNGSHPPVGGDIARTRNRRGLFSFFRSRRPRVPLCGGWVGMVYVLRYCGVYEILGGGDDDAILSVYNIIFCLSW